MEWQSIYSGAHEHSHCDFPFIHSGLRSSISRTYIRNGMLHLLFLLGAEVPSHLLFSVIRRARRTRIIRFSFTDMII